MKAVSRCEIRDIYKITYSLLIQEKGKRHSNYTIWSLSQQSINYSTTLNYLK
jgi:hypothetical protein